MNRRIFQWFGRRDARAGHVVADGLMLAALAWATAYLFWATIVPLGPYGAWQGGGNVNATDIAALTRNDPFARLGGSSTSPGVITNLTIKLFGVRLDGATGQGSAIIAGPDGVQQSVAVGEEIVPGVKLKSVRIDGVSIDRSGTEEQVFLDQSAATTAPPSTRPQTVPGTFPITMPPQNSSPPTIMPVPAIQPAPVLPVRSTPSIPVSQPQAVQQ